jgi:threonyl-tRNA synthetase
MLIVGEKEEEAGSVAVRKRHEGDLGVMALNAFEAHIKEEISKMLE